MNENISITEEYRYIQVLNYFRRNNNVNIKEDTNAWYINGIMYLKIIYNTLYDCLLERVERDS